MATSEHDIELIDGFLRGELDAGQVEQFERRRSDPEFESLYKRMQDVFEHVYVAGRDDLREEMDSWDRTSRTARTVRMRTLVGVAASILIIVVAFFLVQPRTSPDQLAMDYLSPYPNVVAPIQKSGDDSEPDRYQQAFQLYEMGYYNKAQDIFQTLDQSDESVQFYSAVTHVLAEQYDLGIAGLEKIASNPEHRYHDASQWYGALAYLMEGKKQDGVLMLNNLATGKSPYATQAQQVLDELK